MGPLQLIDRASLLIRRDHSLGTILERVARVHGNRRMVEEAGGGLKLTFNQASKRINRWAGGIAASVGPGDRVVIATPNGYEMFLLALAASRAGAIPVPVNPRMRAQEIKHVIADSGATLVIRAATQVDGHDPLLQSVRSDPAETAALFYTSGTTGTPKGVELTHRALVGQLAASAILPAGTLVRGEVVMGLPLAHIMGFASSLALACAGLAVYFLPRFRPTDVLDAIEQRHASMFVGVPAMYRMLLEAGAADRDLGSIRVWACGADAMPPELAQRFKQFGATAALPLIGAVGEAAFVEGYGMVESGGGAAAKISPPFLPLGLGESIGFPLPGYSFRVVDQDGNDVRGAEVGELLIKGPGVTKGYWGDDRATSATLTADGWLHTGDIGRKGLLGSVLFAGRQKDVIKHGGYSVYALEVERAIEEHPEVLEAAATGLPDERDGEIPVAAVRLVEGATVTAEDLLAWASERLADYKAPKRIAIVDDLPRTGTEKVQKRDLVELFTR